MLSSLASGMSLLHDHIDHGTCGKCQHIRKGSMSALVSGAASIAPTYSTARDNTLSAKGFVRLFPTAKEQEDNRFSGKF